MSKKRTRSSIKKTNEPTTPQESEMQSDIQENHAKKSKTLHPNEQVSIGKNNIKKTVFEYNQNQLFELFLTHGVSYLNCQKFLEKGLNGESFRSWPNQNESELKAYLENYLESTLNNNEARHFFAILSKYHRNPYSNKSKIICDSVHGQIKVHPLLIKIIDTTQFQRLRYLKQLGILNYIYPSATHTRFEHCIGASNIAGELLTHLKTNQPSLGITISDELCVKVAALCHDLGHGPFSHLFEEVIEKLGSQHWSHEMATLGLFDKMLSENPDLWQEFNSYGLFEMDIQFIKDLIYTDVFKSPKFNADLSYEDKLLQLDSLQARGIEKSFLFEIVSNYRNGIDVDKFDYFDRDCKNLGFTNNFDYKRYIACTRVIRTSDDPSKIAVNQICVRDKEICNLYEMYHVREYLTRRAYKHETGSSINLMVVEALAKADKHFNFSKLTENGFDLERFEKFNDYIFMEILNSTSDDLKESREILERITKRKLYKYVSSLVLPTPGQHNKKKVMEEFFEFLKEYQDDNRLNSNYVAIEMIRFNYGSKDQNPLDNVRFYNKYSEDTAFKISKEQVSKMLLNVFEDVVVRVYSKIDDLEFINKVYTIFADWANNKGYSKPLYGTA